VQARVLGLVDHTHPTTAQFLDDAVVRDGVADHWRQILRRETGKSMRTLELAVPQKGCCCNILITLIDLGWAGF
jgi:hypothetical protein